LLVSQPVIFLAVLNVRSDRGLFPTKGTIVLIKIEAGVFIHPRKYLTQLASNIAVSEA
jgi:hypothetical protein